MTILVIYTFDELSEELNKWSPDFNFLHNEHSKIVSFHSMSHIHNVLKIMRNERNKQSMLCL
jgi:hypothetical protein